MAPRPAREQARCRKSKWSIHQPGSSFSNATYARGVHVLSDARGSGHRPCCEELLSSCWATAGGGAGPAAGAGGGAAFGTRHDADADADGVAPRCNNCCASCVLCAGITKHVHMSLWSIRIFEPHFRSIHLIFLISRIGLAFGTVSLFSKMSVQHMALWPTTVIFDFRFSIFDFTPAGLIKTHPIRHRCAVSIMIISSRVGLTFCCPA